MDQKVYQADIFEIRELLYKWVTRDLPKEGIEWLDKKLDLIKQSDQKKDIYLAFSTTSRFVGKKKLNLSEEDFIESNNIRRGWSPEDWTIDQAARILIILSIPIKDPSWFLYILKQLFETAEVLELTALYLGLPLYPFPNELMPRAIEGFRTNINIVFNAIALNNPYPGDYLDDAAWNQMVLKAVFIGSPLYKIQSIDQRTNSTLANILSDFAHERWAAGRPVTPELWRCVSPHFDNKLFSDLERVLTNGHPIEKHAAALALSAYTSEDAIALLNQYPQLIEAINNKALTWDTLGKEYEKSLVS